MTVFVGDGIGEGVVVGDGMGTYKMDPGIILDVIKQFPRANSSNEVL